MDMFVYVKTTAKMKVSLLLLRKLDLSTKSQVLFFTKIQICRFIQILLICNTDLSNYFFWIILTRVITFLNVIRQKDEKCILNVGYQALWYFVVIKPVCTSFMIHTRTRPTISSPCFEYEFDVLWPKTWYRNNSYLFIESVFTLSSSCRKNELHVVQYLYKFFEKIIIDMFSYLWFFNNRIR